MKCRPDSWTDLENGSLLVSKKVGKAEFMNNKPSTSYPPMILCVLVLAAMGQTRPATTRAHVYHTFTEIFSLLPKDALPAAGVKWRIMHIQLAAKWFNAHVPGMTFEGESRFQSSTVNKDDTVSVTLDWQRFTFRGLHVTGEYHVRFPASDEPKIAKMNRGDRVRFGGIIKTFAVTASSDDYATASMDLTDCKLVR